jgi:Protein of unknown function (DUF1236)
MKMSLLALLAVALLGPMPAASQTSAPVEVETTGGIPLSPEKQLEVKTSIARYGQAIGAQALPRTDAAFPVGSTVPPSVELIVLPQDAISAAPTTTSYRFVLMKDGIAVVEPDTRKVVQIID